MLKLNREQKLALAERLHANARKEADLLNKRIDAEPTKEELQLAQKGLKTLKEVPQIFLDSLVSRNFKPTIEDLIEIVVDMRERPEKVIARTAKSFYNDLILMDISKFSTIEELEKSITPLTF